MRKLIIVLIICLQYKLVSAQVQLSEIQIPDAPGFVLADKAPASVDKPTTSRAFGISIYSLQQGGALEATPFWYFQHPTYDYTKYLNNKIPIWETFNVSIATFKSDTTAVLSAGFKTHILRIYCKKQKEITQAISDSASLKVTTLPNNTKEEKATFDSTMKAYADSLSESISTAALRIEVAGAYLGSSANNSFKSLAANKGGIWLNASYSPYKTNFATTVLARYSWAIGTDPKVGKDSSFLDYGISISYQKKKFDVALEFLNRNDLSKKENFNRLAFVINYQLTDQITLVSSLGRNFTSVNNIFTVFGAKFGISGKREKL